MGIFEYFKKKASLHNYDSDYMNDNADDSHILNENVYYVDRHEDISFSNPLTVLYHKKTELPFIDKNGMIWLFSESDYFQTALNDFCGTLWETLSTELYVKTFDAHDILPFLETAFYLYGIENACLNVEKNVVALKKYVNGLAMKYSPADQNYEISNPVFRFNSILYNQINRTEFDIESRPARLERLMSKCAKSLFGAVLYCPYNITGDVFSDNMFLEDDNGRYICIYSDGESVGNMAKETDWRCGRMTFAEALKKAFYQSSSMLVNYGSCPIVLTCDDVKYYAAELNSDVSTEDEGLSGDELYNKALAFKAENNIDEYFRLMKKSAELGYALAQNTLGFMYLNGECCEKNIDEAIKYFEASLADFDSSSMTLAAMYNDGNGVEQDFAKALYYYKVASALGNSDAMLKVGVMTLKGVGCEADQEKALSYIIKSAKNGNESAIQIVNALTNEEN